MSVLCSNCNTPFEPLVLRLALPKAPAYYCPKCSEEKLAEQEALNSQWAEELKQKKEQEAADEWASLCPIEFRSKVEGGETDVEKLKVELPNWKEVFDWKAGRKGLIIKGATGTRKTRMAWRLLRKLWLEKVEFEAIPAVELDMQYQAAVKGEGSLWLFNRLATVPVLFIDDLGKGTFSPGAEAFMFGLVDKRTREGRPIIATTNDDGESLKKRAPDRGPMIVRRLRDYCVTVNFK